MITSDVQVEYVADAIDAIKDRMADGEFSAIEEYQQAVADVAALREHLDWLAAY